VKALLLFALLGASCVALRVGGSCEEGQATCEGAQTALACRAGRVESFPCTGPLGCRVDESRAVTCDQSEGALPGTPCLEAYEGAGHCAPAPAVGRVQCVGGVWVERPCPPDSACQDVEGAVSCIVNGTG